MAGYAYFTAHCGFYPHSSSVIAQVEPELTAGCMAATGTLRFPIDQPLPEQLLRRMVELRLSELAE